MPKPHPAGDKRRLAAVVPTRLAVATPMAELPAGVTDKEHERVREQALSWQPIAGHATFWEMAAPEADEGTAYALAGQMASAGEQLALAYGAGVEVALWKESREEHDAADVAREICMRAMAEAQSLFVIGAGHALANVTLRALTLRQGLKAHLVTEFSSEEVQVSFDPFSSKAADWISLNKSNCKKLHQVAKLSQAQAVIDMVEPVRRFCNGQVWQQLVARRGEDFHRWRPQSHGIQGVARKSPWQHDGTSRSLGIGQPVYEEARGLADEVAGLADQAMLELAISMEAFFEAWPAAGNVLGGPNYQRRREQG